MFSGETKAKVADELATRSAFLYHACQLQDFYTYLTLGGVSSRKLMDSKSLPFTKFDSDDNDKKHGSWDLVFGNFSDFGSSYHSGGKSVPNPYGPILIKIDPKAVLDANDFSVTLRSAGARDFNRDNESLKNLDAFKKIFTSSNGNFIKYKNALQTSFPDHNVGSSPEWSMKTSSELIPIEHFVSIIVDPIEHKAKSLFEEVQNLSKNYDKILGEMVQRTTVNRSFQNFITAIASGTDSIDELKKVSSLKEWADSITPIDWQLKRYVKYTNNGTISQLGVFSPPKKAS